MELTNEVLNYGLGLSMEFGENWLLDVIERLQSKFPELSNKQAKSSDKLFKEINKSSHDFVLKESIDMNDFKHFVKLKYKWIDNTNIGKLYSQSCYYARK